MMFAISFMPYLPLAVGLMMGIAGLAIALIVWRNRRRRFVAMHGPTFNRLCEGMHISRFERWRLKRLANKAGLITPAVLLVSRGAFENALVRAAIHPNGRWPESFRMRILTNEPAESTA